MQTLPSDVHKRCPFKCSFVPNIFIPKAPVPSGPRPKALSIPYILHGEAPQLNVILTEVFLMQTLPSDVHKCCPFKCSFVPNIFIPKAPILSGPRPMALSIPYILHREAPQLYVILTKVFLMQTLPSDVHKCCPFKCSFVPNIFIPQAPILSGLRMKALSIPCILRGEACN